MKSLKGKLAAAVFASFIIGSGAMFVRTDLRSRQHNDPQSRIPASLTVLEEMQAPRHQFDTKVIHKILNPNYKAGGRMVQSPVVPRASIESVLKKLDPEKSIPYQLEMKYGLHPYTTSYYEDKPISFASVTDKHKVETRMGVAPNCMLCHASRLEDKIVVGLGNTRVDLKPFFRDLVVLSPTKYLEAMPDLARNVIPVVVPKASWNPVSWTFHWIKRHEMMVSMFKFVTDPDNQSDAAGHSNPWSFAVQLFNWRDLDMNYLDKKILSRNLELDEVVLDPMPWWTLKYKDFINWDDIVRKSHRSVVQAAFSPGNSGEDIRALEPVFKEIFDEAQKIEPPNYPHPEKINLASVATGEKLFNAQCTRCHGIYSEDGVYHRDPTEFKKHYPEKITPVDVVNTDRQRLNTINFEYLTQLEKSWMAYYGDADHKFRPLQREGYLAPPLWGIWASAPYFHNGSVPNLYGVLFPEARPKTWRLTVPATQYTEYDYEKTGLKVEVDVPQDAKNTKIYDTTKKGMSNTGHEELFKSLSENERLELIEYLKTL